MVSHLPRPPGKQPVTICRRFREHSNDNLYEWLYIPGEQSGTLTISGKAGDSIIYGTSEDDLEAWMQAGIIYEIASKNEPPRPDKKQHEYGDTW